MIQQGKISKSLGTFPFLKQWKIGPYVDQDAPALFRGCYNSEDFRIIMQHRGLGVLIWGGTDADMIAPKKLRELRKKTNIKHLAQSGFVARDLDKAGIQRKRIPYTTTPRVMEPYPLGDCVYSYVPKTRYKYYGGLVIDKVRSLLPDYKFIVTSPKQYPKEELFELYKKCFIGLRLTQHDGLPHTVVELELMGRRCVFNDDIPGAIPWTDAKSVAKIIENEKRLNPGPQKVAQAMYDYINIPLDWLDENYWI